MLWEDLIIILFSVSLRMTMSYLDTMPGYSCPKYCGVNHNHYPLDLQSDSDQPVEENGKVNKTSDLALQ